MFRWREAHFNFLRTSIGAFSGIRLGYHADFMLNDMPMTWMPEELSRSLRGEGFRVSVNTHG